MPFIVAPPEDFEDALLLTVIDADHSEVDMLRDLRDWGWNIVRRDSQDPEFIDALAQIEKDIRRRRRRTHAIAGEITGYRERPTLEEVWEVEARKKQRESLWILPEEDEDEEGDHVGQMREPESLLTDETHSIRHGPQNMVPSRVSAHIIWADRTEAQMYVNNNYNLID